MALIRSLTALARSDEMKSLPESAKVARVSFLWKRGIAFGECRYEIPFSACLEHLEMRDGLLLGKRDPNSMLGQDVVLVRIHAGEATEQFPEGDYLVARPTEDKKQLLFEAQTC